MSGIDPYDPDMVRKNRKTGLILAAVVAVVIFLFILRFTYAGLPEDAKEWARIQQRQSQSTISPEPNINASQTVSPSSGNEE